MELLLDTNIVIAYLAGDPTLARLRDGAVDGRLSLLVSVITEYELLRYPKLTDEDEFAIMEFLGRVRVINLERRTAQLASLLSRRYKGTPLDHLIAATALERGIPLLTRNIRDFRRIAELNLFSEPPPLVGGQ